MSSDFNQAIRRAARGDVAPAPLPAAHVGNVGIGVGGGARARPTSESTAISDQIRTAALLVRGRISIDDVINT